MKPVYLIEWIDSEASHEWTDKEEWKGQLKFKSIFSIGFLIAENEKGLLLAVSWDNENKHACAIQSIPHCCIVKQYRIAIDGK